MARPVTPVGAHGDINTRQDETTKVWTADTRVRTHTGFIARVRATGTSETKAKAAVKIKAIERAKGGQQRGKITSTTRVAVLMEHWLETEVRTGDRVSPTTRDRYEDAVRLHILPTFGKLTIRELDAHRVYEWMRALKVGPKTPRTCLRQALHLAERAGAIQGNPVSAASQVNSKSSRKPARAMTDAEIEAMLAACKTWEAGHNNRTKPLRDIVLLQISLGTRISEVLGLRWCDVTFDEEGGGQARITGGVVDVRGEGLQRQATKTAAGNRGIPLPAAAVTMLKRRLDGLPSGSAGSEKPVFASRSGGWLSPRNLATSFRAARDLVPEESDIDLGFVTTHVYRRTMLTRVAAEKGLLEASLLAGHSDVAILQAHYLDREQIPVDQTEIANAMPLE